MRSNGARDGNGGLANILFGDGGVIGVVGMSDRDDPDNDGCVD